MKLVERICFPTDFGKSSEVALESVVRIAKKFGSEVNLIHVLPESMARDKVQGVIDEKMSGYASVLEEQGIKCTSDILQGNHIDKVVPFAERKKANLIVLGAGRVGKDRHRLGSKSVRIIRNSSIPVWVVEKDKVVNPSSVLCPIDFSQESRTALDNAIQLCRRFDSKLHILHVVKEIDTEYAELGVDIGAEKAERIKPFKLELDELIKNLDLSGISWSEEIRIGDPVKVILEVLNEKTIDLLMMGSSGKGALKRLFLGSVAERVLREMPCSFITNKAEGMIHLKLNQEITDIESIYAEGVELANQGFTQEAIVEWKRCIAKNELYFKAWSAIVKAYEILDDTENAERFSASRKRIQRVLWDKQVEADLKSKHHLFK